MRDAFVLSAQMTRLLIVVMMMATGCIADTCKTVSSCSCKTSNGMKVDLSGAANKNPPLFRNQAATTPGDANTYNYDPCQVFTLDAQCKDVLVCQKGSNGLFYAIGYPDTAVFGGDTKLNTLYVQYTDRKIDGRKTTINLVCDPKQDYKLEVKGETPAGSINYTFTFTSRFACPVEDGGLSTGSIMLIIFFVLVVVYVVGGILYMRFAKGAQGIEQVPNLDFWRELPLLVKDGTLFVVRGCKTDTTYEQI